MKSRYLSFFTHFICSILAILSCSHSIAQTAPAANISQLKVAYIFNFSKYFTWPNNEKWLSSQNLNICIQHESVADGAFLSLSGQVSQGKTIQIILLQDSSAPSQNNSTPLRNSSINIQELCHIWFIDEESYLENRTLMTPAAQDGLLTVSDYEGFTSSGGVIEFVIEDGRIKFKVNVEAATEKGLRASALLLELGIPNE